MNKKISNNMPLHDVSEWKFPTIQLYDSTMGEAASHLEEISFLKEEVSKLKAKLNDVTGDYNAKITFLNDVMEKLQNSMILVDDEINEAIKNIIVKCTKKIIQREIMLDTGVIQQILDDVKDTFQDNNGLLRIHLSHNDFDQLFNDGLNDSALLKRDENLGCGDILVKSEKLNINGMLDDRIKLVLGI